MYKNINSASRIHALLSAASGHPNKAIWEMWAEVFAVKGSDHSETAELVSERLNWLHIELQLLQVQAKTATISPHLYEGSLARIRSLLSPLILSSPWDGSRGNLTADVLLSVAFLNELLPDEENAISDQEFQRISDMAAELASSMEHSDLPEALRRLIDHHLQLIAKALAQYKVFGARALREAGRTALGEIVELKDTVQASKQSEEMSRLGKLWKQVNGAADAALKAEKIAQLGHKAWEAASGLLS
ncbi:hypothetical protein BurJ1DRAFT_1872 [Burkholderiales bacterium JOSHI_001]|nr:hypothetical protein BurJ1DRAFT_1872 [Burkholderiales bacterium JOSHI_001]